MMLQIKMMTVFSCFFVLFFFNVQATLATEIGHSVVENSGANH